MKKFVLSLFPILIVLLFSFPAIFPLFHAGFFPMHDDTQVARVYEMAKSLRDGMFPVRWVSDLGYGYGYPIFNFYAPLAYYFGAIFILLGLNALLATKIMFIAGILLAGISMYFWGRELWGILGGVISGVFYQYASYHAIDIYVRGDVAEFWAYGFIPLVFLSLYNIYKNYNNYKCYIWVLIGSLSYAAVILSHNLTAMMATPFLLAFILVLVFLSKNKLYSLRINLYPLFLGILLSAFYWLPALSEMKFTNVLSQIGGGADYRDHFVCLQQFWYSPWGYGGSAPNCVSGMSFMIGKIHIIFVIITSVILLFFFFIRKKIIHRDIILLGLIGFFITIFLQTSASQFIWQHVPFMSYFQYPWRFLILTSFFASMLAGAVLYFFSPMNNLLKLGISAFILIPLLTLQSKFFVPQKFLPVTSDYYTNQSQLQLPTSKISDEYLPRGFKVPKNIQDITMGRKIILSTATNLRILENKTQILNFLINSSFNQSALVRIAPFPAWHAYVNGKIEPIRAMNTGYMLDIPAGEQNIIIKYDSTNAENLANIISLFGVFLLILGIIYFYEKST